MSFICRVCGEEIESGSVAHILDHYVERHPYETLHSVREEGNGDYKKRATA